MTMNRSRRLSRPARTLTPLLAALALVIASAVRGQTDTSKTAAKPVAVPIVTTDPSAQKALEELNQTLDSDPKLDALMSKHIDELTDAEFRQNNPSVDILLKQKPEILPALKIERHFLIHRYIARIARGPLLLPDIVALDGFLTLHTDLRKALEREPSRIVDDDFLVAHPSLANFFDQHPSLSTLLLEPPGNRPAKKTK
jgi:hypothetical protein